MNKRESGWYRVWACAAWLVLLYDHTNDKWDVFGDWRVLPENWLADKKMVMTLSGGMVYHNQHDPLYNTKHEG